jgi:hypothetical protein
MFVLIGFKTEREYGYGGWTDNVSETEENIALFDAREQALKYIEDSTLASAKTGKYMSSVQKGRFKFKSSSLLHYYDSANVSTYYPEELPLNPVFI